VKPCVGARLMGSSWPRNYQLFWPIRNSLEQAVLSVPILSFQAPLHVVLGWAMIFCLAPQNFYIVLGLFLFVWVLFKMFSFVLEPLPPFYQPPPPSFLLEEEIGLALALPENELVGSLPRRLLFSFRLVSFSFPFSAVFLFFKLWPGSLIWFVRIIHVFTGCEFFSPIFREWSFECPILMTG